MNNINNLKNNYISNNNSDNNINTNSNTDTDTDKSFIESNNKSTELNRMNSKKRKRVVNLLVRSVGNPIQHGYVSSGIGKASFVHALVVIFLEFFAWGLLTDQVITVLNETFPNSTFLANGLIHGLKGLLSFLSAPLIGAMSDIWGRKVFLLITVFFTCLPIPLMRINTMWYFAMISISGLFAVTFSVVFAYVADVTDESNRTTVYGLVSATFAASLITSPAIGSYLSRFYSENFVIALATAIAIFDLFFILVAVPESLPEKIKERSKSITWENVDPFKVFIELLAGFSIGFNLIEKILILFKSLRVIFADRTITLLCITVFLSYLPEAGQYSCFFVYLKLIVGFSQQQVAYFIAYVGILSCIAQAAVLVILIRYFGSKQSIIIGLTFQVLQLAAYGFAAQSWLIWFSGLLAAVSSIGYPAISAYISNQSHADQQGVSQGMVTGIRGLCNGIGPALYGFIFWIFNVNLNEAQNTNTNANSSTGVKTTYAMEHLLPGPPFLFGSILALSAIFVISLIPSSYKSSILISSNRTSKDHTLVKIGNSSNTYNRTSSTSSMAGAAANDINATTSAAALLHEQEPFLLNESQTNAILSTTSSSSNTSLPNVLTANSNANNLANQNQETQNSTAYFSNSYYNEGASLLSSSINFTNEYSALKNLNKQNSTANAGSNSNINELNRLNSNTSNVTFLNQFDSGASILSKPAKSHEPTTTATTPAANKYFNPAKLNLD